MEEGIEAPLWRGDRLIALHSQPSLFVLRREEAVSRDFRSRPSHRLQRRSIIFEKGEESPPLRLNFTYQITDEISFHQIIGTGLSHSEFERLGSEMPFSPRRGGSIRVPNRRGNKYFARRYRRRSPPPLRFEETMMRRSRAIGPQKVRGPLSTSSLRDNLVVCLQDSKREKREKCFTMNRIRIGRR